MSNRSRIDSLGPENRTFKVAARPQNWFRPQAEREGAGVDVQDRLTHAWAAMGALWAGLAVVAGALGGGFWGTRRDFKRTVLGAY